MTDKHPITPPPELVQQWSDIKPMEDAVVQNWVKIATKAAQWGADQELEACINYFHEYDTSWGEDSDLIAGLRAARRPKPQSLNSIALQMLGTIERDGHYIPEITDTIRRALKEERND